MKKTCCFLSVVIVAVLLSSCGGVGGGNSGLPTSKVDFQMFSNDEELTKVFNVVIEKLGDNIHYVDKVTMYISRPSKEGIIQREGSPDTFGLSITHLYEHDKRKLYEMSYNNESKWYSVGSRSVEVHGRVDKETFRLEDEMFDMSPLTPEMLCKIVKDAQTKFCDAEKYSFQYVKDIEIEYGIVEVTIYGKLAANDLEKSNYYKADMMGNEI